MLKIRIAVTLLFTTVVCGFIVQGTASQKGSETNKSATKLPIVEKAQTKCNVEAYRDGVASEELKTSVIRARPDKNSPVLKNVITKEEVIYYISGTNNKGWFEI
jgi:hypothetical protein